jgi:hypothetical protein
VEEPSHLDMLKEDVRAWNEWRVQNPSTRPDLTEADLRGAFLQEADLRGANLQGAGLIGTDLRSANLQDANLRGASLEGADLTRVDLREAYFTRTNLQDANLQGAILEGAQGLTQEQIELAVGDETTRLPTYLSRPVDWRSDARMVRLSNRGSDVIVKEFPATRALAQLLARATLINSEARERGYRKSGFDISFKSMLLAFLISDDPWSQWFQPYVQAKAATVDKLLEERHFRGRKEFEELDRHAIRSDTELEMAAVLQQTPDGGSLIDAATELRNETGRQNSGELLDVRHLIGAYIYRPPARAEEDLISWGYDREGWSNALLERIGDQYPAELDSWVGVHQRVFRSEEPNIAARALADGWSTEDYLKFSDYADALADLIKDKKLETPLTISIDAPWGMGKTTLMRMIKGRLERDRSQEERSANEPFPTVWFNAWQYDKEESLWAALILEILAHVRPKLDLLRRVGLWWDLNKEHLKLLLWNFLKSLLIVLVVLAVVLIVWRVGLLNKVGLGVWEYVKILGGLGILLTLYTLGKDIYKKITNPFKLGITKYISSKPNYEQKIGFLHRFNEDFECVVSWVTNDGTKKLVIFIDDLDRSAPRQTAEVIEAISMLLDSEGCVFVLGMDSQMVASSIEVKYKDLQDHLAGADGNEPGLGRRFLEKIVQIPFAIPRTDPKAFDKFIENNLEVGGQTQEVSTKEVLEAERLIEQEQELGKSLDEAAETVQVGSDTSQVEAVAQAKVEIRARSFLRDSEEVERAVSHAAPYLEYNPRKVKRFINLFKLQALIANRRRLLDQGTIKLDQLSKWLLISTRWPAVIETAIDDQDFVGQLLRANDKHNKSLRSGSSPNEQQEASDELARLLADSRIKRFYGNNELIRLLSELSSSGTETSPYLSLTEVTTGTS